jgi:Zn-dependent M28 family amino/carboxypeptidase
MNKRIAKIYLTLIGFLLILVISWYTLSFSNSRSIQEGFDGERAYEHVLTQVEFGSRAPGTVGHTLTRDWIESQLTTFGWKVTRQEAESMDHPIQNIIAFKEEGDPVIILAAHYDTRYFADEDPVPSNRLKPVPGANDGASGVAVLLELSRTMSDQNWPAWLVFFDAEDNGRIEGWDWILGSTVFVQSLGGAPEAVVVLDMIGDSDLQIYYENNSDPFLRSEIWATASELGFDNIFISQEKYSMLDDHTPFVQAGIPAVDIIDFDYPYWHTTEDTPDKVSAASLDVIGTTVLTWITEYKATDN